MGVVFQDRKSTNNICNNVVDVLKKTVHVLYGKEELNILLYHIS